MTDNYFGLPTLLTGGLLFSLWFSCFLLEAYQNYRLLEDDGNYRFGTRKEGYSRGKVKIFQKYVSIMVLVTRRFS